MPFSLYIHYPYCNAHCPYCDFNVHVIKKLMLPENELVESYINALKYFKETIDQNEIKTIFFGGGTPSLLKNKSIDKILNQAAKLFKISKQAEISIEANPTELTENKIKGLKAVGINRLSIGVQSLNNKNLKFLGRLHSAEEFKIVSEKAKKYFDNISADFIYGLPNQTLNNWKKELMEIINLKLPHYSMYQLTIEEGTPFYKMKEKGIFNMNEEIRAKLFTKTSNFMEENGYINYETSNFAKPGYESKHNLTYWEGGEYLGIGSGAHSRIKIKNKWYEIIAEKNPLRYKKENPKNLYFKNKLSNLERANEIILSSMRLKEGLKEETLEKQTDIKFANVLNEKIIEEYQKLKLLVSINTTLKLTDNGRKFANKISADIID